MSAFVQTYVLRLDSLQGSGFLGFRAQPTERTRSMLDPADSQTKTWTHHGARDRLQPARDHALTHEVSVVSLLPRSQGCSKIPRVFQDPKGGSRILGFGVSGIIANGRPQGSARLADVGFPLARLLICSCGPVNSAEKDIAWTTRNLALSN